MPETAIVQRNLSGVGAGAMVRAQIQAHSRGELLRETYLGMRIYEGNLRLLVPQAVSHPGFGDQIMRPGGIFFQFAAQVEDHDAEIGVLLNIRRPPDLL